MPASERPSRRSLSSIPTGIARMQLLKSGTKPRYSESILA